MGPDPAANNRFIANSGEVCRYSVCDCSVLSKQYLVLKLCKCGSVTVACESNGVSTSRIWRSAKKSRISAKSLARQRRIDKLVVGCQLFSVSFMVFVGFC